MRYSELERLICAAAINETFRAEVVRNPRQAALTGYLGQSFTLSQEELDLLGTVERGDFQEFAAQVGQWILTNRNGHYSNGNGNGNGSGKRLTPKEVLALPKHTPDHQPNDITI